MRLTIISSLACSDSAVARVDLHEGRAALGRPIDPIQHQTVQMDVQIGGRAEALDQRDRAAVGLADLEAGLLKQEARDDPVVDLQHRR